jgi:hypothetical protein
MLSQRNAAYVTTASWKLRYGSMDISRFPPPPSPWPARVVRDLEVLGLSVAIGLCVWLGGSLLAEQIAHPSDTRQMLSDRVDLVAPSQTTGPDAPDAWVDEQDLEASHVGY